MSDKSKRPRRRKSSREDKIQRKSETDTLFTRKIRASKLNLLNLPDAQTIHDCVKKILWELGAVFDDVPTAKMLVRDYGCREGENGFIRIPPDLVDQALSSVPNKLILYDQNGKVRVDTSHPVTNYCPGHNCVRILDDRTGLLRPCELEDVVRCARLCEQLQNIDMSCSLGYPSDVNAEDEAIATTRALIENCSKPAALLAHDDNIQTRIWTFLADVMGGWDNLAEKPIALELMGPVSPLKLPDELCRRIINSARWRVPLVCYPATFPGMSSLISIAGAVAQSSAEAIAGIVLHQLSEPGAPVMSGSAVLPMDMRQANIAYGSPEYMLAGLSAADYFQHIGIPSWIGAGCSDSHDFDAQAAAEAGANMSIAALSDSSFVHNLGFLSGGRTGSLEMLVLCDELVGWSNQMAAGVDVSQETVCLEAIKRAVANNDFLTDPHTQSRFLTESWYPELLERSDAEAWQEAGGSDLRARIREKINFLIN